MCHYTQQSHETMTVFWRQRVVGTQKVVGPQLAGVCRVATLCRVLSGPSAMAKPLPCVLPAHHRGQGVCRVPAWPRTQQSLCLPCFWPAWHTADSVATTASYFLVVLVCFGCVYLCYAEARCNTWTLNNKSPLSKKNVHTNGAPSYH
jgi:hypothetical protein